MTRKPGIRVGSFAVMTAAGLALGGCATTRTTAVRPDMLPALSESAAKDPTGERQAVTPDGQQVSLTGPMSVHIAVQEQGRPPLTYTYTPGFTATQSGDRLALHDDKHAASYALADILEVKVEHTRRNQTGVVLMGVSIAPAIIGAGSLALGVYYLSNTGGDGAIEGVGRMFTGIGVGLSVAALVLLAAGGSMFAASPRPAKVQRPTPALELGPGGARVRVAF